MFVKRLVFFRFVDNYIQTSADDVPLGQLSLPDDVIISQLLAISRLFSSYPPAGAFCQVSKLTIQTRTWPSVRNVYLIKIGPKSLGHTRRDICKDKESNLGPVAAY